MANVTGEEALELTADERRMLDGERGEAVSMAMRLIVAIANVGQAERLRTITGAHIDGCLYHGPLGLEFAERLADAGGLVAVPTTLNVSALDLLHPELIRLDDETRDRARRQMAAYERMGCRPTWTCAPYQLPDRPRFGEHIAWAESNAIVFANSVLGARTGRYGDFVDISAALTGRVPDTGLHLDENRRARMVFRLDLPSAGERFADELYGLIGHVIGQESGGLVPAIVGLPPETSEDQLKALAAASASSGAVAMFHAVGITPEAPTLADAVGNGRPDMVVVTPERLRRAWSELSTVGDDRPVAAVSVGTPHMSATEIEQLVAALAGRHINPEVDMYASTGRDNLAEARRLGLADQLAAAGVQVVVDTCTYITPIMSVARGSTTMTNSAKWAWYAPGNMDVDVVYGSLTDCVESAVSGRVVRNPPAALRG